MPSRRFAAITPAPPDPILGLAEAFKADPRPGKINLSVGVYRDDTGATPVLDSVREAERRLLEAESTKAYKPITGDPQLADAVQRLILGRDHTLAESGRLVTAHAPGGTGGLRVVGDLLAQNTLGVTLWLSEPTWANHPAIFEAAGVKTKTYPYYDAETRGLDFDAMISALRRVGEGDVVLLHGCCHNPTGVDPTLEQWGAIADVLAERGALPLVDFAYQGFGEGIDEDAAGVRLLAERLPEMIVVASFSKNFGLYQDRAGAAIFLTENAEQSAAVASRVKIAIRRNYSNPPAHGGEVVKTILLDDALRAQWIDEVAAMRSRIHTVRGQLEEGLDARGVSLSPNGNGFLTRQSGMFSFTGLTKPQVDQLRDDHAIYIVGSGRINVAGITAENLETLCRAIAEVV